MMFTYATIYCAVMTYCNDFLQGLFSKRRHLLLTNLPRLLYFDPETEELKGEIPWSDEHPVKCIPVSEAPNYLVIAL